MRSFKTIFFSPITYLLLFAITISSGCHLYKFNDTSIDPTIKTVKIVAFGNRATYVDPQLSPKLTDKFRQKLLSQTKLSPVNDDNADWEISGYVSSFLFTTSAISNQQVAGNRLTVSVHVTLNDHKNNKTKEYDVNWSLDFNGSQSQQQVASANIDEMVRSLSDGIFNKLFSDW